MAALEGSLIALRRLRLIHSRAGHREATIRTASQLIRPHKSTKSTSAIMPCHDFTSEHQEWLSWASLTEADHPNEADTRASKKATEGASNEGAGSSSSRAGFDMDMSLGADLVSRSGRLAAMPPQAIHSHRSQIYACTCMSLRITV